MIEELENRFRQYKNSCREAESLRLEIERLETIQKFISIDTTPEIERLRKSLENLQNYNVETLNIFYLVKDPEISEIMRMRYFEGLNLEIVSSILYLSPKTIQRRSKQGFREIIAKISE